MNLIFAILNKDMLEDAPIFQGSGDEAFRTLCFRIAGMAETDKDFVAFTLQDLMNKGFITRQLQGEGTRFSWAHNNRQELVAAPG